MTSSEIRQSFLDFFREKGHTIVPSSPLLPDSPNLLFTNAGMNQFVPIFLGHAPCPYKPARAADTQKCIRAGGKHNDLEDVGFDTYHHTFFEMLGNWSFGDYFKKEAIEWAWELVVGRWKFPASRLYATVYQPGAGDPAGFDQEAHDQWAAIFKKAGLDPAVHIVNGNKKDNFWMMGDTGPCGPCSELHVDLTPGPRDLDAARQQAGRALVNQGDARCIEIWNLVFIQFNANPDGTFVDLPAKHVDTGMGFERVTSMIQGTKGLTDFSASDKISNYETDVFRPLFDELEKLTGKKYNSTLPGRDSFEQLSFHLNINENDYGVKMRHAEELMWRGAKVDLQLKFRGSEMTQQDSGMELIRRMRTDLAHVGVADNEPKVIGKSIHLTLSPLPIAKRERKFSSGTGQTEDQESIEQKYACDVAFRVIADHVRTLSFSIADGIQPSNEGRGYVLRRILRRAVRYGRNLGLREPFLGKLVDVLGKTMGQIFSEVVKQAGIIKITLKNEEESFFRTLERGIELFEIALNDERSFDPLTNETIRSVPSKSIDGGIAFRLYDTYGFPLDLTELMARERGLTVDIAEFNRLMEEQKNRSKAATKSSVIEVMDDDRLTNDDLKYGDQSEITTQLIQSAGDASPMRTLEEVVPEQTPFYVAMGGQVGDTGFLKFGDQTVEVTSVERVSSAVFHYLKPALQSRDVLPKVVLVRDQPRRAKIEAHHSGTHIMHWALRKVLGNTVTQKGSYVGPDRLRFDFSHGSHLTPEELAEVEKLVNEKIAENGAVKWEERPYAEVKGDPSILQFFGDKYGELVRVVSIGEFSKELCGGTHVRETAKIGYFKILHESAIAAGVRRIEAASGDALKNFITEHLPKQEEQFAALRQRKPDLAPLAGFSPDASPTVAWKAWEAREAALHQAAAAVAQHEKDEAKRQEAAFQKRAAVDAPALIAAARTVGDVPFLVSEIKDAPASFLPVLADALKTRWQGVAVLALADQGKVALLATVSPSFTKKVQAGKIIQAIAPLVGGKGGGRPELAQGGGSNPGGLAAALAKAEELVRGSS